MSKIEAIMRDLSKEVGAEHQSLTAAQISQPSLSNVLRVIGPLDGLSMDMPLTRHSPPEDWSDLIERVRTTAARVREVEAEAEEQELRVRDLLERVREDIKAAHDSTQAAEARALDVQIRTEALLKAADERVKAAEERAKIAEGWLTLVRKTFAEEFEAVDVEKRLA